jgi:hypothetical protein
VAISKRPVEETEHVATDVRREVPISEHVESTVP